MAEDTIPPEIQEKIQRLQTLSGQLQSVAQQRQQIELMRSESKRAREALEDMPDDATVYRSLGGLLVQDDRTKALERLSDDLDTLEVRLKRYKEQEGALQRDLQALQAELEKALR